METVERFAVQSDARVCQAAIRRRTKKPAARLENANDLLHIAVVVLEMLDRLEGRVQVIRMIRDGQSKNVRDLEADGIETATVTRVGDGLGGTVEAADFTCSTAFDEDCGSITGAAGRVDDGLVGRVFASPLVTHQMLMANPGRHPLMLGKSLDRRRHREASLATIVARPCRLPDSPIGPLYRTRFVATRRGRQAVPSVSFPRRFATTSAGRLKLPRHLAEVIVPRFPLVMLVAFALTLFTSATLLFLVQPMIGKMILPLLGGTPEVWNTCMVFFQAVLLAGYAYAHATTRWLGVRKQAGVHLVVLLLPVLLFAIAGPLAINKSFIVGGANPIPGVLLVLLVSVGLPFFVVSTTSPLLQQWFSSTDHPAAGDPYFLSTASNLGSMLALIGYPLLVEPWLRLREQRLTWAVGYGLYILLTGTCAVLLWKSGRAAAEAPIGETALAPASGPAPEITEAKSNKVQATKPRGKGRTKKSEKSEHISTKPVPKPEPARDTPLTGAVTLVRRLRWIRLAFVPSSLMMGVTTYITTDVAAIPLLWVLPLGLYLLSFILVFSKLPRWVHQAMIRAMPLMVLLLIFMMLASSEIKIERISIIILLHLLLLFLVSMVCHGEMVRDRPPTRYLTEFYMLMSVGGVLGGIFNALIAPVIFNSLAEYSLAMVAACMLLPPLVPNEETEAGTWGYSVDLTMVSLFTIIGLTLIWLRLRDPNAIPFSRLKNGGWGWPLAAVLIVLGTCTWNILRSTVKRLDRGLDLALPVTLLLLTLGLIWGLNSEFLMYRVKTVAGWSPLTEKQLRVILTFGLPAILCYTMVEPLAAVRPGCWALFSWPDRSRISLRKRRSTRNAVTSASSKSKCRMMFSTSSDCRRSNCRTIDSSTARRCTGNSI